MKKVSLMYGSDPEFFVKVGDKVVGSERFVPANGADTGVGRVVRDGFQVELNPQASDTVDGVIFNIAEGMRKLNQLVSKSTLGADAHITFKRVVDITQEEMDSMSKKSKIFGCMPSYNIYGDSVELPSDASKIMFRSAGGHIHLGSTDEETSQTVHDFSNIVRMMDLLVGIPLVLIDNCPEDNARRRQYYGRAGEFRMPPYGVEYRTSSNVWLKHPELARFVYDKLVTTAVALVQDKRHDELFNIMQPALVQQAINESIIPLARELWDSIVSVLVRESNLSQDDIQKLRDIEVWSREYVELSDSESLTAWINA